MKQSISVLAAMTLLLGIVAPAFAENLSCKAGDYLVIQGELENEIFTAQMTLTLAGQNVVDAPNLKYKKSEEHFRLVEDDASRSVAFEGRHFVPEMLNLTLATPSLVNFFLPYKDAQGQLRPVLVRAAMTCEKVLGIETIPQYSLY